MRCVVQLPKLELVVVGAPRTNGVVCRAPWCWARGPLPMAVREVLPEQEQGEVPGESADLREEHEHLLRGQRSLRPRCGSLRALSR